MEAVRKVISLSTLLTVLSLTHDLRISLGSVRIILCTECEQRTVHASTCSMYTQRTHDSCQILGKWGGVHGRMPLSQGRPTQKLMVILATRATRYGSLKFGLPSNRLQIVIL